MTTPLPARLGAVTLVITDLARSKAFYGPLLDTPVWEDDASVVYPLGDTVLNLLLAAEVGDLVAPASLAAPSAGTPALFSFWVDDVDATCAALRENGVELLNGPVDRPWAKRTAAFADPDGHLWEVAQDI